MGSHLGAQGPHLELFSQTETIVSQRYPALNLDTFTFISLPPDLSDLSAAIT